MTPEEVHLNRQTKSIYVFCAQSIPCERSTVTGLSVCVTCCKRRQMIKSRNHAERPSVCEIDNFYSFTSCRTSARSIWSRLHDCLTCVNVILRSMRDALHRHYRIPKFYIERTIKIPAATIIE